MITKDRVDLALKLIATLIAVFGIWKYFADRATAEQTAAKNRSLGYIERFAGKALVDARGRLLAFWKDYPEFAAVTNERSITQREYALFVNATYPNRSDRAQIDGALFQMQVFLDEVAYCRGSGVCDAAILDGFFCDYVQRFSTAYAPFYERLSRDIGAAPIDAKLRVLSTTCGVDD